MKTRIRAVFLALVAMLGIGLAMPASASASTSPVDIWSTYAFRSAVVGRTTFQVVGNSGVDVILYWSGGPTERVYVAVWRKRWVFGYENVGSCVANVVRGGVGWCHINTPASNDDHVLYLSKRRDGRAIAGWVYWH